MVTKNRMLSCCGYFLYTNIQFIFDPLRTMYSTWIACQGQLNLGVELSVNAVSTAETCSRGTKFVQYLDCVSGVTKSWRRALCECSKYGRNMQQRHKICTVPGFRVRGN